MNPLSWLLYFAEVVPNISIFLFTLGIACTILTVTCFIFYYNDRDTAGSRYWGDEKRAAAAKSAAAWMKRWPKLLAFGLLFLFLSDLIPSKQTIYLIAASEVGEEVVKDPRVQSVTNKSFQAIEAFLDEQIAKADQPAMPTEPEAAPHG
jgi:hypothetical protein